MNLKILCTLLNEFGIKVFCKGNVLEGEHDQYYDYSLVEKQGNKWVYGVFMQERESNPHFNISKKFDNESDVTKEFFIKELGTDTRIKLLSPRGRVDIGMDIYKEDFTEDKFRNAMDIRRVPQYRFSTIQKDVSERTVMLLKENIDKYRIYFIGKDNKIVGKFGILLNAKEALFWVYKLVFTLDFFEKEVVPVLKREGVYEEFTEEDVYAFVS
ncbi:MAG: hypothetical protein LBQ13_01010 [Endomicrobium sp.]|jgi:hypothetical protein|nr:hypothetical protein [Endomicrobium sp.]